MNEMKRAEFHQGKRDILTGMLNVGFTEAGLTEGTNAHTIKTVNTFTYRIASSTGLGTALYNKTATDNIAMTACDVQAVSTYCLYLVSIDSGGTVTVTKGDETATNIAVLPDLPANNAPIGYFKIVTDASTTFTSGTTDLSAAGITETYDDLSSVVSL